MVGGEEGVPGSRNSPHAWRWQWVLCSVDRGGLLVQKVGQGWSTGADTIGWAGAFGLPEVRTDMTYWFKSTDPGSQLPGFRSWFLHFIIPVVRNGFGE